MSVPKCVLPGEQGSQDCSGQGWDLLTSPPRAVSIPVPRGPAVQCVSYSVLQ